MKKSNPVSQQVLRLSTGDHILKDMLSITLPACPWRDGSITGQLPSGHADLMSNEGPSAVNMRPYTWVVEQPLAMMTRLLAAYTSETDLHLMLT